MSNILIIGAGGVSQVATVKCAMNSDVFTNITLASRTKSKCDAIAKFIKDRLGVQINTAQIDADDTAAGRLRKGWHTLHRYRKLRASRHRKI